jgi:hypothetical protein
VLQVVDTDFRLALKLSMSAAIDGIVRSIAAQFFNPVVSDKFSDERRGV